MYIWNTLRSFNTARFTVELQCSYDYDSDLESFDSATIEGIGRGAYAPYCFRVVVLCNGREIGADYLGESIYANPGDFAREHFGHNHGLGRAYFPDMLRSAIAEARITARDFPRVRDQTRGALRQP